MRKSYLLTGLLTFVLMFSLAFNTLAQDRTVFGVVTSDDGLPMPGVSVVIKGTSQGTITDGNGAYSLQVPDQEVILVFTFVGYKAQEIAVPSGQSQLDITIQEDTDVLDEVVVIGYGTQKKELVSTSVSTIDAEGLEDRPLLRVEQSLQGMTTGVQVTSTSGQPGAGATVRIRGTGSINGRQNPLYVIDGVIFDSEGGLDFLNQNDIESITVLKDAASSAIYGSRGGNGVIIITTKSGKKGKARLSYNAYYGTQNPWKKLDLLNAQQYAKLQNDIQGQEVYPDPSSLGTGTNWQDLVFTPDAPIQNHDFSVSGGTDVATYYFSANYFAQDGIVAAENSNIQRLTLRFNADYKASERFQFGYKLSFASIKSRGVSENSEFGSPLGRALNIEPTLPLYETDTAELNRLEAIAAGDTTKLISDENGTFAVSRVGSEIVNPLAALYVDNKRNWANKVVGSLYGSFKIMEGLKLRSDFSTELSYWGEHNYRPVHYLNAVNQIKEGRNVTSQVVNSVFKYTWDNFLHYNKTFNKAHNVSVSAGTSFFADNGQVGLFASRQSFVEVPGQTVINSADPTTAQSSGNFEAEGNFLFSVIGRVQYDYKEKYLFSASIRRDGSSRFGENYRFGRFPAISLGWVVSEESFFNTISAINFLKVRGSWGRNGVDPTGNLLFLSTVKNDRNYTFGQNTLTIGVSPDKLANPNLRWEQGEQLSVGFEARLFKSINFTFDYFKRTNKDLILDPPAPLLLGNDAANANLGTMTNEGIELDLGYDAKVGDFTYTVSANASYLKNKVLHVANDNKYLDGARYGTQGLVITRITEGLPIGHFFGYQTDGIFQNEFEVIEYINDSTGTPIQPNAKPGDFRFVDINNDGKIDDADRTNIGDPTPSWTYGININLAYKGLDLSILGQGVAGNKVYRATRRYDLPQANYTTDVLNRWTGEGTSTTYPSLKTSNFDKSSDFYVEDGSYFRIKNVQLGYTLLESVSEKLALSKLRIYISANNLLTFTKYTGFDPEIGVNPYVRPRERTLGLDRGIYPQARAYILGINVTFK